MELNISIDDFYRDVLPGLEAIGQAPPEEKWPPRYEDLPYEAQEALRIFYILPNRVSGSAGFVGKDLSAIESIFNIYEVPFESRREVFSIITHLINKTVESASKKLEAERKRASAKSTQNIRK